MVDQSLKQAWLATTFTVEQMLYVAEIVNDCGCSLGGPERTRESMAEFLALHEVRTEHWTVKADGSVECV